MFVLIEREGDITVEVNAFMRERNVIAKLCILVKQRTGVTIPIGDEDTLSDFNRRLQRLMPLGIPDYYMDVFQVGIEDI